LAGDPVDFEVGAVIDLTPGDGMLATAALQARLPYTGLVFTPKHADALYRRLESQAIAGVTREGDTWYDQQLVETLAAARPTTKLPPPVADPEPKEQLGPHGKPKPKEKPRPQRKPTKRKGNPTTSKDKKDDNMNKTNNSAGDLQAGSVSVLLRMPCSWRDRPPEFERSVPRSI
jgi:hypothetical protein